MYPSILSIRKIVRSQRSKRLAIPSSRSPTPALVVQDQSVAWVRTNEARQDRWACLRERRPRGNSVLDREYRGVLGMVGNTEDIRGLGWGVWFALNVGTLDMLDALESIGTLDMVGALEMIGEPKDHRVDFLDFDIGDQR